MGRTETVEQDLTSTQYEVVRLDFLGHTADKIAELAGCGRVSVFRWRKLPAYQRAMAELQTEANRAIMSEVRAMMGDALKVTRRGVVRLGDLLDESGEVGDAVAVTRASLDVLKVALAQNKEPEQLTVRDGAGDVVASVTIEAARAALRQAATGLGDDELGVDEDPESY
jgi:hypothetical protein